MSDPRSDETRRRRRAEIIQRQLDEALDASFPASDPVSIVTSHHEEDWDCEERPASAPQPAARAPAPKAR